MPRRRTLRGNAVLVVVVTANEQGEVAGREARLGSKTGAAREFAYHSCTDSERKKRNFYAFASVALVQGRSELTRLACEGAGAIAMQVRPPWGRH